ncbi:alpha-N-acetylglucosaminidase [Fodinicola acaciae]|uniref:alpha-N-acetylglucosaminidase n=1 Tax=Fodinicola acaciae TaxID=2681555 RepID=UPI0013D2E8B1|nr:alpha-N-acetylglucosaminidase [Fodinicola acaciae]
MQAAIFRLVGTNAGRQFAIGPLTRGAGEADAFEIGGTAGHITVNATSTVAAISGVHWWLKYVAGGHLSTNGDRISLPDVLPAPATPVRQSTELAERYAYNFTVFGYTTPFWTWSEWTRELDYLAASGTNRALALVGQEIVWYDTFRDFGMDELAVRQWIAQPAHQPWQWYGEITGYDADASGYSGPVSVALMNKRAELGNKIIDRMKELGITPVFPAFVGHVPDEAFADLHPGTHIPAQSDYAGHPRPYWLDTTEALFPEVAARFYAAQKTHFGTTTHYSNDLFFEVGDDVLPSFLDGADLGEAAKAVQDALNRAVPDAIWILQGWQDNPRLDVLNAVDENRVVVMDLDSDDSRKWQDTEAYWGVPWSWGTIANFGGRLGMFGNLIEPGRTLQTVRTDPARRRLVGTAWVPEGTHQNPVVADLLGEVAWRHSPVDLETWIVNYARRRYGVDDPHAAAAWRILLKTAYSYAATGHTTGEGPFETPFAVEPTLTPGSACVFGPDQWRYDPAVFAPCLTEMLAIDDKVRALATYQYDLVDVTRQQLANRARLLVDKVRAAYQAKNEADVRRHTDRFLRALDLTEQILATNKDWLLGTWLEQAKSWATDDDERKILEWNARSILTIWTSKAQPVLRDYANRDWLGLLSGYYRPRWKRFFDDLPATIASGHPPTYSDWGARGDAWSQQTEAHPTQPSGDPYAVASRIAAEIAGDPV